MPAEPLTDSARDLLSARADQFFSALRGGKEVNWETYLDGLSGETRVAVLVELVAIDLGHRGKAGQKPRLDEYLERFPELGPNSKVPTKLILEECRCRIAAGETIDPAGYRTRFPAQFDQIKDNLDSIISQAKSKPSGTFNSSARTTEGPVSVSQQYDLVKKLGQGMFGEVWLARKNPSGIEKAIKILLHPIEAGSAQRELRSLELIKNLRHPYLLATEDFWVHEQRLHIVMELADNTLTNRLKFYQEQGHAGLPTDELYQYIHESAEGLDYLHEHKVTHRDVKPDNILLLRGHAKVADFGLARQQDNVMASMSFAGTPIFMAPEVWGGEGGPASDQYSLALVYTQLRQGQAALKAMPIPELMMAHLEGKYDFADFIPEEEQTVLRKALSRQASDRYPSCMAFAKELARTMGKTTGPFSVVARANTPSHAATRTLGTEQNNATLSVGAFKSAPVPQAGVGTLGSFKTTAGTQIPIRPKPGAKKGNPKMALIAGGVVLALLGGLAFVVFSLVNGKTTPTTESTTPSPTTGVVEPPPTSTPTTGTTPTTKPIVTGPTIPKNATAVPDAKVIPLLGKSAYDWIAFDVNGQKVRFRLIPGGGKVKPFYISETKVWNSLYQAQGDPNSPVFNITAKEAAEFAVKFGGFLPTPEEWDYAAGFYEAGSPPLTVAGGTPWVNQSNPRPTHGVPTPLDVNPIGLIDIVGNGREWTRAIVGADGNTVRLIDDTNFPEKEKVILRGRNFTLKDPLTLDILKYEQKEPQTQYPLKPSPYTTFRVVVPLP